jgi:hypothetical protein
MSTTAHLFTQTDGTTAIDTWLTQEAGRIGKDVHRHQLYKGPWSGELLKKGVFPTGQGYKQSVLIYERTLPNTAVNADADAATLGASWTALSGALLGANAFNNSLGQSFAGAAESTIGPQTGMSFLHINKSIKQYEPFRSDIRSPKIGIEDLRFSHEGMQQLEAITELMNEAVSRTWEERHRNEYDKACANLVPCLASNTPIVNVIDVSAGTVFEGTQTWDVDFKNDFVSPGVDIDYTPTAHISNYILDKLRLKLNREGAKNSAYGMEKGAPVYGLVISSQASDFLYKEDGVREDVRKNSGAVSKLIEPLGIDGSFRGFYHLCDDLAPRMNIDEDGVATRIFPETMVNGVLSTNPAYETAEYEVAYILHKEVMEVLIPEPMSGYGPVSFDPVTYTGEFAWINIPHETLNPRKQVGHFHASLASASKVVKPRFGFAIVYKRESATPAK